MNTFHLLEEVKKLQIGAALLNQPNLPPDCRLAIVRVQHDLEVLHTVTAIHLGVDTGEFNTKGSWAPSDPETGPPQTPKTDTTGVRRKSRK